MLHDTIILDVGYRDITRKADGKQFRIYEITDAQGTKWTTNRKDIAGEANRLINKRVEISGRIEEKGVYTNHYLDDLRAVDGQQSPVGTRIAQSEPPTTSSSGHYGSNVTITGGQISGQIAPSGPTDRDWSIWRQTATKVAASLSTGATEFWRNVDDLIAFYAHGQKPQQITPQPQEISPSPQPSAASPPGEYQSFSEPEPERPQFDSDIPF